ncbi:MAG: LamG-like jellyroll fold domain-containing protein, partial [Verrucomicrobiota bacterium]
ASGIRLDGPGYLKEVVMDDPVIGGWHLLCGTKKGEEYTYYVDGTLIGRMNDEHALRSEGGSLHLMHHGAWGKCLPGRVNELMIWDRALSEQDVRQLDKAIRVK